MALSFAVAAALLLQPAAAVPCSAFTSATGLDFDSTVRSPAYPSGVTQPTAAACCGACAATPGCTAYVYEPAQRTCFPLASYSGGAVPNPDRVIGAALPPCAWSPALPSASLAGCAGGGAAPCPSRADLATALAACASDAACGGVTSQAQGAAPWELRAAATPAFSPANATSYYILNGGACRLPSPAPPAPPPSPPSPAGAPPEWQAAIRAGDMLWAPAGDASVAPDNLPMIGNGFLAQQLMADSLYCAGVFAGHGLEHGSHRARIPSPLAVPAPGPLAGPAALDVRQATYYRRSVLAPAPGGAPCTAASPASCVNALGPVTLEQRWYAHRALPSLAVMEVAVIASASAAPSGSGPYAVLRLSSTGMAPSADFNFSGVPAPAACGAPGACAAQVGTTQGGTECPPGDCGRIVTQPFTVALLSTPLPAVLVVADAAAAAAPAYFFTVVRTSIETPVAALVEAAGQDFAAAGALAAAGTLHAAHAAEWAETVWSSGFSTDRADAALAVNTSLYSIVSSLRADRPYSTSPGGLANDGYNGHSFWDCETWMWPSLNLLLPDLAASMLEYRVATLPGAYFKATTYSPPYSGASFAWESAVSGIELASAPWGTDELHIGSDIAAAVWAFWVASQDASGPYLNATAWPLMQGIADFWMSKLAQDNAGAAAGAALHLRNVMGPDEYSDHVDDSVYTNAGVIQALTHAAAVGALVGQEPALLAPWLDAAARLTVVYDAAHGYHPESANYTRGLKVKQADTVLLGFPFEFQHATFSPATRAADLAYYAGVTDPGGPAMTWGVFAVGLIELGAGFEAAAAANFNRSFANAQPPFDVWTETPTGGTPNFLTGAGGYLQTAFNGYTGLRVNASGAFFSPGLGEGMGTLGLRGLAYLGNRLSVTYNASSVTVEVAAAAAAGAGGARDELAALGLLPPHPLSLLPRVPLAQRSQRTRVRLGNGHVQPQLPLQLLDAAGAAHALLPGQPLVLPRQPFAIVRAR